MERTTAVGSEEKEKYKQVLHMDYMSSEHSHSDEEHGSVFVCTFLPWRSDMADKLFNALDKKHQGSLSKKSKRMGVRRLFDEDRISQRKSPPKTCPNWALDPNFKKRMKQ